MPPASEARPGDVWAMRHGAVTETVRGRLYGRLDVPLHPAAREQMRRAARDFLRLREALYGAEGLPPVRVVSSPLSRCRESASLVLAVLREAGGNVLPPLREPALLEVALGRWEGLRKEDIQRSFPVEWAARGADPARVAPPGGESFQDVQRRALAAVRRLRAAHAGECLLCVSHAGVIRCLMAQVLALPLCEVLRLRLPPAALVRLDEEGEAAAGTGEDGRSSGLRQASAACERGA